MKNQPKSAKKDSKPVQKKQPSFTGSKVLSDADLKVVSGGAIIKNVNSGVNHNQSPL